MHNFLTIAILVHRRNRPSLVRRFRHTVFSAFKISTSGKSVAFEKAANPEGTTLKNFARLI